MKEKTGGVDHHGSGKKKFMVSRKRSILHSIPETGWPSAEWFAGSIGVDEFENCHCWRKNQAKHSVSEVWGRTRILLSLLNLSSFWVPASTTDPKIGPPIPVFALFDIIDSVPRQLSASEEFFETHSPYIFRKPRRSPRQLDAWKSYRCMLLMKDERVYWGLGTAEIVRLLRRLEFVQRLVDIESTCRFKCVCQSLNLSEISEQVPACKIFAMSCWRLVEVEKSVGNENFLIAPSQLLGYYRPYHLILFFWLRLVGPFSLHNAHLYWYWWKIPLVDLQLIECESFALCGGAQFSWSELCI